MTSSSYPETRTETYCGDGVYASWDGYHVVLRVPAGSSANGTEQTIALEPAVWARLIEFRGRAIAHAEETV